VCGTRRRIEDDQESRSISHRRRQPTSEQTHTMQMDDEVATVVTVSAAGKYFHHSEPKSN
jgi:hypothetical protein